MAPRETSSEIETNDNHGTDNERFRMVALDLDGTLLTSEHKLHPEQAAYLRNLYKESGFRICIATGRAAPSVYDIVEQLGLEDPTPVVCSNGAKGFLLSLDESGQRRIENLFDTPLSEQAVLGTIQLAEEKGYFVQYYVGDGIYANPKSEKHRQMVKEYEFLTDSALTLVNNFEAFVSNQQWPSKMLVRCHPEEFKSCHPAYVETLCSPDEAEPLAHIVAAYNSDLDWFLEILHPSVNKGLGLQHMCSKLDIPLSQTIAMGDGTNDLEFLQLAGLGIAMHNAHDTLKEVASYTTEWTNDEHGVTKTLQQLEIEGKLYSHCDKKY